MKFRDWLDALFFSSPGVHAWVPDIAHFLQPPFQGAFGAKAEAPLKGADNLFNSGDPGLEAGAREKRGIQQIVKFHE